MMVKCIAKDIALFKRVKIFEAKETNKLLSLVTDKDLKTHYQELDSKTRMGYMKFISFKISDKIIKKACIVGEKNVKFSYCMNNTKEFTLFSSTSNMIEKTSMILETKDNE